jgi:hypothetical protein
LDAAKLRLTTAEEKSKVNEGLARILPVLRLGAGRRSIFQQRAKQQLNARVLPAAGTPPEGATGPDPGVPPAAAAALRISNPGSVQGGGSAGGAKDEKKTLGLDELLFVLRRNPVYARSAAHYRVQSMHALRQAAAANE